MKFSLRLLMLLLLWAALLINGLLQHRFCNELSEQIQTEQNTLESLESSSQPYWISRLAQSQTNYQAQTTYYEGLTRIFKTAKIKLFELKPDVDQRVTVARITLSPSDFVYKIHVPAGRQVQLGGHFRFGAGQSSKNKTEHLSLQAGEYTIEIRNSIKPTGDLLDEHELNVTVFIDEAESVVWRQNIGFESDSRTTSGGVAGIAHMENDNMSLTLMDSSYRTSKSNKTHSFSATLTNVIVDDSRNE